MADKNEELLQKIVSNFPAGISLALAYGSGIFNQKDNVCSKNMLDFVFVLEDALQWHEQNLQRHPSHYSFVKSLGVNAVVYLQDRYGAGLYYNTLVPMEGRTIKYGTVNRKNFLVDLNEWVWLYLAGRLHKPVRIIHQGPGFSSAMEQNLYSAVNAALLCLPESFTEEELYLNVGGLSYAGDLRMIIGENKNKVQNIVLPNVESFRSMYHPVLSKFGEIHFDPSSRLYKQSIDAAVTYSRMLALPKNLQRKIVQQVASKANALSVVEVALGEVSKDKIRCSELVRKGISSIVRTSSVTQSLKGVLSAGTWKTLLYSSQKLTKMLRAMIPK